jgi:hypothetical protein
MVLFVLYFYVIWWCTDVMYNVLDLFHILGCYMYRIYGMQINSIQFNSVTVVILKFSQCTKQFMIPTSNVWVSSANMAKHPSNMNCYGCLHDSAHCFLTNPCWDMTSLSTWLCSLLPYHSFCAVAGHHLPPDMPTVTFRIHAVHHSSINSCRKTGHYLTSDSVLCSLNNPLWCRKNWPPGSAHPSLSSPCWDRWMFSLQA